MSKMSKNLSTSVKPSDTFLCYIETLPMRKYGNVVNSFVIDVWEGFVFMLQA